MTPKIISAEILTSQYGGKQTLRCNMGDGSIWECNLDGSGFAKITPSFDELSEKLKELAKNNE